MQAQQKRQDYYLLNPPRQPKREIAEYVGGHPRIFDGHKEGRKASDKGIRTRARSEHWQDYFGVSGMVDSPLLDQIPHIKNEKQLKDLMRYGEIAPAPGMNIGEYRLVNDVWVQYTPPQEYVRKPTISTLNAQDYFDALKLPESARERFWKDMSFSYWEELGGYNLTIVADSAIANKHHIMVRSKPYCGYAAFEGGKLVYSGSSVPNEIVENARKIIGFYENKRNLPRFDSANCPIIEAQLVRSNVWFLQYLKAQPFEHAAFSLDRPPAKNELVAEFTRGATVPGGSLYMIRAYDSTSPPSKWAKPFPHQDKKDGIFDHALNVMLREIALRTKHISIKFEPYGLGTELDRAVTHNGISGLFKPKISLIFKMADWHIIDAYMGLRKDIPVWLEADGNKAYLKLL